MSSPSHRSDKILEIHTKDFSIVIKSKTPPLFENAEESKISTVDITAASLKRVKIDSCKIDKKYTLHSPEHIQFNISPLFFENTDYEIVVQSKDFKPVRLWHENPYIRERISPVTDGSEHLISGIVNFGNNIGFSELIIIHDGNKAAVINIEIFPTRISYKDDFALIQSNIKEEMHSSAVKLLQKRYKWLNTVTEAHSPTEKLINIISTAVTSTGLPNIFGSPNFVFQSERQLMKHIESQSAGSNILKMSVSDTARLYEYWCFIKLVNIIKNHNCRMISEDIITSSENGITVGLPKDRESAVEFINSETDEKISLLYVPSSDGNTIITLTAENRNGSRHQYIFAPRYRVSTALSGDIIPNPDDIDVMHRCRNTAFNDIVADTATETRGAFVLFPYSDEEKFSEHSFYKSIETANVGGLPFLPDALKSVTKLVEAFISESKPKNITLSKGYDAVLSRLNFDERDVLVGSLGSLQQFEDNLEKQYYYVPERNFELERLPIHVVALYQSARLFGEEAGIRYFGDVTECRRVRRKDITAPMRHNNPDEWYYLFKIREWNTLPSPIKIKGDSVFKPKYTNLFLLHNSDYSYELFNIHSGEEFRLTYELKYILNAAIGNKNPPRVLSYRLSCGKTVYLHDGYFDIKDENGGNLFEPPLRLSQIFHRTGYYFDVIINKLKKA